MTGALPESYRFCRDVARRQAKNFYYSFRLLPEEHSRSMCALYAFMRRTDDLADEPGAVTDKRAALASWRAELDAALAGTDGAWPGWPALADTMHRHGIPPRHLHEVIDGVLMDVEPLALATFDELRRYCYHVASAVGLCCIHIWGFESDGGRAERLAESCGIALQLTNILRDVGEDARLGRTYLPAEDLGRFGVEPAELLAERPSDAVRRLLAFQAERARGFYREAEPLVDLVAPRGRPGLRALVRIYRGLLDEIEHRDYDVLSARVSLPAWKKAALTLGSILR